MGANSSLPPTSTEIFEDPPAPPSLSQGGSEPPSPAAVTSSANPQLQQPTFLLHPAVGQQSGSSSGEGSSSNSHQKNSTSNSSNSSRFVNMVIGGSSSNNLTKKSVVDADPHPTVPSSPGIQSHTSSSGGSRASSSTTSTAPHRHKSLIKNIAPESRKAYTTFIASYVKACAGYSGLFVEPEKQREPSFKLNVNKAVQQWTTHRANAVISQQRRDGSNSNTNTTEQPQAAAQKMSSSSNCGNPDHLDATNRSSNSTSSAGSPKNNVSINSSGKSGGSGTQHTKFATTEHGSWEVLGDPSLFIFEWKNPHIGRQITKWERRATALLDHLNVNGLTMPVFSHATSFGSFLTVVPLSPIGGESTCLWSKEEEEGELAGTKTGPGPPSSVAATDLSDVTLNSEQGVGVLALGRSDNTISAAAETSNGCLLTPKLGDEGRAIVQTIALSLGQDPSLNQTETIHRGKDAQLWFLGNVEWLPTLGPLKEKSLSKLLKIMKPSLSDAEKEVLRLAQQQQQNQQEKKPQQSRRRSTVGGAGGTASPPASQQQVMRGRDDEAIGVRDQVQLIVRVRPTLLLQYASHQLKKKKTSGTAGGGGNKEESGGGGSPATAEEDRFQVESWIADQLLPFAAKYMKNHYEPPAGVPFDEFLKETIGISSAFYPLLLVHLYHRCNVHPERLVEWLRATIISRALRDYVSDKWRFAKSQQGRIEVVERALKALLEYHGAPRPIPLTCSLREKQALEKANASAEWVHANIFPLIAKRFIIPPSDRGLNWNYSPTKTEREAVITILQKKLGLSFSSRSVSNLVPVVSMPFERSSSSNSSDSPATTSSASRGGPMPPAKVQSLLKSRLSSPENQPYALPLQLAELRFAVEEAAKEDVEYLRHFYKQLVGGGRRGSTSDGGKEGHHHKETARDLTRRASGLTRVHASGWEARFEDLKHISTKYLRKLEVMKPLTLTPTASNVSQQIHHRTSSLSSSTEGYTTTTTTTGGGGAGGDTTPSALGGTFGVLIPNNSSLTSVAMKSSLVSNNYSNNKNSSGSPHATVVASSLHGEALSLHACLVLLETLEKIHRAVTDDDSLGATTVHRRLILETMRELPSYKLREELSKNSIVSVKTDAPATQASDWAFHARIARVLTPSLVSTHASFLQKKLDQTENYFTYSRSGLLFPVQYPGMVKTSLLTALITTILRERNFGLALGHVSNFIRYTDQVMPVPAVRELSEKASEFFQHAVDADFSNRNRLCDGSIQLYTAARKRCIKLGDHETAAMLDLNAAVAYQLQGESVVAMKRVEETIEDLRAHIDSLSSPKALATALRNKGTLLYIGGEVEEAKYILQEAQALHPATKEEEAELRSTRTLLKRVQKRATYVHALANEVLVRRIQRIWRAKMAKKKALREIAQMHQRGVDMFNLTKRDEPEERHSILLLQNIRRRDLYVEILPEVALLIGESIGREQEPIFDQLYQLYRRTIGPALFQSKLNMLQNKERDYRKAFEDTCMLKLRVQAVLHRLHSYKSHHKEEVEYSYLQSRIGIKFDIVEKKERHHADIVQFEEVLRFVEIKIRFHADVFLMEHTQIVLGHFLAAKTVSLCDRESTARNLKEEYSLGKVRCLAVCQYLDTCLVLEHFEAARQLYKDSDDALLQKATGGRTDQLELVEATRRRNILEKEAQVFLSTHILLPAIQERESIARYRLEELLLDSFDDLLDALSDGCYSQYEQLGSDFDPNDYEKPAEGYGYVAFTTPEEAKVQGPPVEFSVPIPPPLPAGVESIRVDHNSPPPSRRHSSSDARKETLIELPSPAAKMVVPHPPADPSGRAARKSSARNSVIVIHQAPPLTTSGEQQQHESSGSTSTGSPSPRSTLPALKPRGAVLGRRPSQDRRASVASDTYVDEMGPSPSPRAAGMGSDVAVVKEGSQREDQAEANTVTTTTTTTLPPLSSNHRDHQHPSTTILEEHDKKKSTEIVEIVKKIDQQQSLLDRLKNLRAQAHKERQQQVDDNEERRKKDKAERRRKKSKKARTDVESR